MTLSMFSAVSSSTQTPGPGAYETDKMRSFGGSLSLKMKIHERFSRSQGYLSNAKYVSPRSSLGGAKFTIRPRYKEKTPEPTVGPNFLPDPKENFRKGVTIKSRYDDTDKSGIPGPGKYSPHDPVHTSVPAQGNRGPLNLGIIPDSPGPAAYEVSRDFAKEAHKFTIRQKTYVEPPVEENPGYAFNNPGELGKDARKVTFSKSKREPNYETDAPGPGTYEVQNRPTTSIGPFIHQTLKRKDKLSESADILYDLRQYPEVKQKTIAPQCGKGACDVSSDTPGPSYFPETTLELRPLSIHERFDNKNNNQTPGPGDYTPMDPGSMSKLNTTIKGPSERIFYSTDKSTPGPQYKVEIDNDLPRWTIGGRTISQHSKRFLESTVPPRTAESKARISISKRARSSEQLYIPPTTSHFK